MHNNNNNNKIKKKPKNEDINIEDIIENNSNNRMSQKNFKVFLIITFFMGVLLTIASYAWFSASVDVKIDFFDVTVSSDSGLFISLDGIDFTSSIEISRRSVITDLFDTYSNHTNQWSSGGFWPVSSNGINNTNADKFAVFAGSIRGYRGRVRGDNTHLNTVLIHENNSNADNVFISFDLFLKNVSGSPNPDNLYIDEGTFIDFDEDVDDETQECMSDIMNSMRIGIVRIGSIPSNSEINDIQNIQCNNNCQTVIYEPNSTSHSQKSIDRALEYYNITLIDGQYTPTFAVIKAGQNLQLENGHPETGIPVDTEHFALQQTITDFENPIFQIPHGITKVRVYVWIEGQDLDSLETNSKGAPISMALDFVKDLAGYEF